MKNLRNNTHRLVAVLGSQKFFWAIVVLMVVQALWIALSNRYPMAFDEDYHLGIIRLYAHHISPFWSAQPANADVYGAMYRDPSFLYHYALSFPYRLIALVIHGQTAQVIALRMLNIALFASSLFIFRRLFLLLGASRAMAHTLLLIYVLIPVVPLLAAQINYDNLFIPLVGLLMLWLVEFTIEVRRYKRINSRLFTQIILLCILGSLVKYPFLPFALAATLYIAALLISTFKSPRKFLRTLGFGFTLMSKRLRWILLGILLLSLIMFTERYGLNVVRYHTPVPDCAATLNVQRCSTYGPWIRDFTLSAQKTTSPHNPVVYLGEWLYGMWLRLFFMVDGPATQFQTRGPLTVPALSAIAFAVSSAVLVVWYSRRLWRDHRILAAPLLLAVFYIVILWLDGYEAYRRTGQPVAINGRYLLPVLPVLLLIAALAWRYLLSHKPHLKPAIACVAVICLLWGGGVLTFILRSSDSWYWPSPAVHHANNGVRKILAPVTPGADKPTQYLH